MLDAHASKPRGIRHAPCTATLLLIWWKLIRSICVRIAWVSSAAAVITMTLDGRRASAQKAHISVRLEGITNGGRLSRACGVLTDLGTEIPLSIVLPGRRDTQMLCLGYDSRQFRTISDMGFENSCFVFCFSVLLFSLVGFYIFIFSSRICFFFF